MKLSLIGLLLLISTSAFAQTSEASKAQHHGLFHRHYDRLHCWVSGFDAMIGAQTGTCRGAGKKYSLSILGLGAAGGINFSHLKLEASRPFNAHEHFTGVRVATYGGIGAEVIDMTATDGDTTTQLVVTGYGVGVEFAIEYDWLTLEEIK